jgi:hypothetical protein
VLQPLKRSFNDIAALLCAVWCAVLGTLLAPTVAQALDSASVLPTGINSPAVRMGFVSGIGQRYLSDGSLMSLNDYNSIEFDASSLMRIEPRLKDLVSVLNQFGRHELGNALHLGALRIATLPEVRYLAPLHAYGVTSRWTVALGVPIVNYTNRLSLAQSGSNVSAIRSQVTGISRELDDAFDRLNVSLVASANQELATKGYKPLANRDETYVGDLQVASLYQFHASKKSTALWKTFLNLPTGPGDDPDDLADLGIFGQTAIDQVAIMTTQVHRRVKLSGKASYRFNIPDSVIKRVPRTPEDSLPDASTKEMVRRKTGDSASVGVSGSLSLLRTLNVGLGYDITHKSSDVYTGDSGSNYQLLSRETESSSHRLRAGINYDTVIAYLDKQERIPAIVSYEISDTIRGRNVERQTIHELWLTLFF